MSTICTIPIGKKINKCFATNHFASIGEQLGNYLNNVLEATAPEDAPNFDDLRTNDSREAPSRQNFTTTPVFTKENP